MYNYNTLSEEFLQYKNYLGYKYKSDSPEFFNSCYF